MADTEAAPSLANMAAACVAADLEGVQKIKDLVERFRDDLSAVQGSLPFPPSFRSFATQIAGELLGNMANASGFSIPNALSQLQPTPVA